MSQSLTPLVIPKRSRTCAGTEKTFQPGSEVFSVVFQEDDGNLSRKDYCPSYWMDKGEDKLLAGAWAHWKVKVPDLKKNPLTKHESAMVLLNELLSEEDKGALAHLFGQYLFRNKHLASCGGNVKKEKNFTYYEVPQTGDVIAIKKVPMSKDELPAIEEQLLELIKLMHGEEEES